jgi:hypothetical protein
MAQQLPVLEAEWAPVRAAEAAAGVPGEILREAAAVAPPRASAGRAALALDRWEAPVLVLALVLVTLALAVLKALVLPAGCGLLCGQPLANVATEQSWPPPVIRQSPR